MIRIPTTLLSTLLCLLYLSCLPVKAAAFTWTVPTHFNNIQAAINGASNGDRIKIGPGLYRENLSLNGKDLILEPVNNDFQVIIDGQGSTVITLNGAEPPTTIIRNLTIQNGGGTNGGGINSNNSLASIRNCLIQDNTVTGSGGGIYNHSGTISGCRIINNKAAIGGGIANSDGLIQNSHIAKNTATQYGGGIANASGYVLFNTIKLNKATQRGGGISDSSAYIGGNDINENETTTAGTQANPGSFGGGLANCTGIIEQNKISGNLTLGNGGGMDNCTSTVRNNIISLNQARSGGGLNNCNGRVEHNVIYGNSAVFNGGGIRDSASPVNCVIWSNLAPAGPQISGPNGPDHSCVQDWLAGGPGVVTVDPDFVKPQKGDFHLNPTSPLIDAGRLIVDTLFDFENDLRGTTGTLANNGGDGSKYDIGADEFIPPFVNLNGLWKTAEPKYKLKKNVAYTKLKGALIVTNQGNVPSGVKTEILFYLSSDAVLDPGDQLIGKPKKLKSLKAGGSKQVKVKAKLPPGQVATGMYMIAHIDAPDLVVETDEADNEVAAGPLP